MSQSALAIARMILDGFDDYREHFRQITDGARERFEKAQWQQGQAASAARINGRTTARVKRSFRPPPLP